MIEVGKTVEVHLKVLHIDMDGSPSSPCRVQEYDPASETLTVKLPNNQPLTLKYDKNRDLYVGYVGGFPRVEFTVKP